MNDELCFLPFPTSTSLIKISRQNTNVSSKMYAQINANNKVSHWLINLRMKSAQRCLIKYKSYLTFNSINTFKSLIIYSDLVQSIFLPNNLFRKCLLTYQLYIT